MQKIFITLAIVATVALIHFSYVDFRFRYRDGFRWFWLLNPAPPLMWVGRATIILALLLALSVAVVGATAWFMIALALILLLHIASLILLEVREPR